MTRREILRALALSPLGAAALRAADFWEQSDFTAWDGKDVQEMLFDSPWAQKEVIAMGPPPGAAGGGGMGGGGRGGRGGGGRGGGGGGGGFGAGGGGGRGGGGGGMGGGGIRTMTFFVRWHSALPVKQALVAAQTQAESASITPEMRQFLEREETHYIINVLGLPARMQRIAEDTERLKQFGTLHIDGRGPIPASGAQANVNGADLSLYFLFPREGNEITADDKEVEFAMKLGGQPRGDGGQDREQARDGSMQGRGPGIEIKSKFKLKKMTYKGELAL